VAAKVAVVSAALLVLVAFALPTSSRAAAVDEDASLTIDVPEEVTLGLLPRRLELSITPATIHVGVDCGMADMCGIDPCLCGNPDAYGACACNGTRAVSPALRVKSSDEQQVKVVRLGGDWWLVPWGDTGALVELSAQLPHHADETATLEVNSTAPFAPGLLYVGLLLMLLAGIVLVLRRLLQRQDGKGQVRISAALAALLAAGLLVAPPLALLSCAPALTVTERSPRFVSASVLSRGDGSEAGQRVEVRLTFSAPVALADDRVAEPAAAAAAVSAKHAGLDVTLNDSPLDTEAILPAVTLEGDDTLLITLLPAPSAGDTSATHYFALYEGRLRIAATGANGGLAGLVAADDKSVNAVLAAPVEIRVPSGLVLEPVSSISGSAFTSTPASATFRVTQVPLLRAVAWIEIEPGGAQALVHNHEFTRFSHDAIGCESYAETLVDPLRRAFGSDFDIVRHNDAITVTARETTDGQLLKPRLVEGVVHD
jgi:hypothetical protein